MGIGDRGCELEEAEALVRRAAKEIEGLDGNRTQSVGRRVEAVGRRGLAGEGGGECLEPGLPRWDGLAWLDQEGGQLRRQALCSP